MAKKPNTVLAAKKQKTIDEVFWIYGEARVDLSDNGVWVRFDHDFVRIMNAENISAEALAKKIGAPWETLHSSANRQQDPKWMTPHVIGAMMTIGFDVTYILTAKRPLVLKPEEAALLDNYRNMPSERKKTLEEVGVALAEPKLNIAVDGTYSNVQYRK